MGHTPSIQSTSTGRGRNKQKIGTTLNAIGQPVALLPHTMSQNESYQRSGTVLKSTTQDKDVQSVPNSPTNDTMPLGDSSLSSWESRASPQHVIVHYPRHASKIRTKNKCNPKGVHELHHHSSPHSSFATNTSKKHSTHKPTHDIKRPTTQHHHSPSKRSTRQKIDTPKQRKSKPSSKAVTRANPEIKSMVTHTGTIMTPTESETRDDVLSHPKSRKQQTSRESKKISKPSHRSRHQHSSTQSTKASCRPPESMTETHQESAESRHSSPHNKTRHHHRPNPKKEPHPTVTTERKNASSHKKKRRPKSTNESNSKPESVKSKQKSTKKRTSQSDLSPQDLPVSSPRSKTKVPSAHSKSKKKKRKSRQDPPVAEAQPVKNDEMQSSCKVESGSGDAHEVFSSVFPVKERGGAPPGQDSTVLVETPTEDDPPPEPLGRDPPATKRREIDQRETIDIPFCCSAVDFATKAESIEVRLDISPPHSVTKPGLRTGVGSASSAPTGTRQWLHPWHKLTLRGHRQKTTPPSSHTPQGSFVVGSSVGPTPSTTPQILSHSAHPADTTPPSPRHCKGPEYDSKSSPRLSMESLQASWRSLMTKSSHFKMSSQESCASSQPDSEWYVCPKGLPVEASVESRTMHMVFFDTLAMETPETK